MQPHDTTNDTPVKLCECGCGQPAPIARRTNTTLGHVAGQPIRFIVGHHNKVRSMRPLPERFWEKVVSVDAEDCWLWMGALDTKGYGVFGIRRTIYRAHRIAWELTIGPINDGLSVCHKCDNPRCVNPAHLFLGTQADNMQDMSAKKRNTKGPGMRSEDNPNSLFTNEQVAELRKEFARSGLTLPKFAAKHNVRYTTMRNLIRRFSYRDV